MKRLILACICIVSIHVANAQDRIVFKNADELEVKVTNISPDTVTYKRWNNLEGPTYTINKSDISLIFYNNGTKDIFNNDSSNTFGSHSIILQGYINTGLIYSPMYEDFGPILNANIGIKVHDYLYTGFETGIYSYVLDGFGGYIPLAINFKGFLAKKNNFNPFINCSLGGYVGIVDWEGYNGFYCQIGAGVDLNKLSLSFGYNGWIDDESGTTSSVCFKIGFRFGGKKP